MTEQETAANPADEAEVTPPAQEATEVESEEAQAPAEGAEEETDELDELLKQATGADEATPPELVEVEIDGKTVKVSADAKDYLLRHADYTRKTMDLAEERKTVEAQKEEISQLRNVSTEKLQAAAAALQAKERYETLFNTPTQGLSQEEINALRLDLQDAERAYAHHAERIEEVDRKEREFVGQQVAKAVESAKREASMHIPNFSDARILELESFASSLGAPPGSTKDVTDPIVYRVLHLADIGQKFIERSRQAKQAKAAVEVQPAAEVAGKKSSAGQKDLVRDADKMAPEEWLKQRNAQLAKRG